MRGVDQTTDHARLTSRWRSAVPPPLWPMRSAHHSMITTAAVPTAVSRQSTNRKVDQKEKGGKVGRKPSGLLIVAQALVTSSSIISYFIHFESNMDLPCKVL